MLLGAPETATHIKIKGINDKNEEKRRKKRNPTGEKYGSWPDMEISYCPQSHKKKYTVVELTLETPRAGQGN